MSRGEGRTDWTRNDPRDEKLIIVKAGPTITVGVDLYGLVIFPTGVVGPIADFPVGLDGLGVMETFVCFKVRTRGLDRFKVAVGTHF